MVSASGSARTERMQLFYIVAIPVSLHVRVKDKEGIKEPKFSLKMFISLESCHESHQGGLRTRERLRYLEANNRNHFSSAPDTDTHP